MNKLNVNQQALKRAWTIEQEVQPEDWQRWLKQLTLELMKQSTSHALRACVSLANSHEPLARELFNAAFYSCWVELNEQNKVRFPTPHTSFRDEIIALRGLPELPTVDDISLRFLIVSCHHLTTLIGATSRGCYACLDWKQRRRSALTSA